MRACKSTNIMYAYVEQVNQHHADQIDLTMSPLQFLMDKFPGDSSYDHEQAPPVHCVWYTACVRRIVCCMCSARTLHLRGMCMCMCMWHVHVACALDTRRTPCPIASRRCARTCTRAG